MHCSRIMAPNHHFMLNPLEPVSRTYQYRKVMKPMLERRRRARINKCLDELKDLMTGTLQADGENVSKLEKADILELTVRHLQRLREHNALFLRTNETLNMEKFWAGFQHCAVEVSQFLSKYDQNISGDLVKHMASYIPNVPTIAAATATATVTSSTVSHTHAYINNCNDSNSSSTSLSSNNSTSSSRKATVSAHQRLTVADIPQQHTSSRHAHESKSISKSTISAARFSLHPYARATTAAANGAVAVAGCGVKTDPIGGDDDANVWRPW